MDSGEERASRKKSNDKDTPFSIKLLCSYTGERIEECAMPRRDGSCSMCNTQRANLNKQVTFLSFEDFDQVSELSQFLNRLDHPNIPKVRAALNQTEPTLVVDRIHPVPVKRWLDHQVGKWVMWTVDSTGTQYLQLEEKYSKVFRYFFTIRTFEFFVLAILQFYQELDSYPYSQIDINNTVLS